ncbi:MAG TPA: DUF2905 domain-containing protein [Nitrospirae bacterium]|nr:DUF2905 domain-containing protein [Nitrospirota bacterium]HDO22582.1 DUF2905 domain-containing protein [Nitrospirota bacterium]HDZ87086.1 DUF2905 domain-containing protein [Nitrospirota bacterium]
MDNIGKLVFIAGLLIALIGIVLMLSGRIPWIGRLPGDIMIKKKNFTFYFPLATSILVSIVLSLILLFFSKR